MIPVDSAIPSISESSYPVRGGNHLRPLIDGRSAFTRICEAIEAAHCSVWVTVTFMWESFRMPGSRGTALSVLSRAATRGLDVRIIFWRPDAETAEWKPNAFWGAPEHYAQLEECSRRIGVRWDRAAPGYCQHQKSWLIDAGEESEIAFVGGINLNPHSMVSREHRGDRQNHDIYLEVSGPSAVDVHHNFVQRWNEASERDLGGGRWGSGSEAQLQFPTEAPVPRGEVVVQIQRTIHAGRYFDGCATPGHRSYDIAAGERAILEQYCAAIRAARTSIYAEHQHVTVDRVVEELQGALERGVEVVLVLPGAADIAPELAALKRFENCTLAGIAGIGSDGARKSVWVHSKLMLVDDVWGTVGSCNLHGASAFGNCELNATFWHAETARVLRVNLLSEHLDRDTASLDDLDALRLFRKIAAENRQRFAAGDHKWQGLAFLLAR